jgi:hypothetical protein
MRATCRRPVYEDRTHLLGVARTTCGSKSRAKVASDVPRLRFHALLSASGSSQARVPAYDVLQSPPLSLFEHPLSSLRDPMRGWSARSAMSAAFVLASVNKHRRPRIRDRFDLALPFTRNNPLRFTGATPLFLGRGVGDRRRYAHPRRWTAAR